jgi:serine/threonine-protein kinase
VSHEARNAAADESPITVHEGRVARALTSTPPPGVLVDDTFRILGSLGRGGMAEVVLALDVLLDRRAALKFLGSHLMRNPTWRARFVAEARSMARLRHEHVVHVYSFGVFEDRPYFAMEYVPGLTLAQQLDGAPLADPAEAISILCAIADGLDAIHDAGLVHAEPSCAGAV